MLYVFGDCVLDMRLYALYRDGALMPLGPKTFSVLAYLIRHRDHVVLKQELSDLLWPGQFVSDAALARCIASLRKAVGDTGEKKKIIKTFYGHGYRFVAAVEERPCAVPRIGTVLSTSSTLIPPHEHVLTPTVVLQDVPPPASNEDSSLQPEYDALLAQDEELREVTVLCGGLARIEVLTTCLAPETLHQLICGFFEQVWHAVQRSGGLIHSFLDEHFLALFGAIGACEKHMQQALQAVTWLRQSLCRPDTSPDVSGKEGIGVRLGMHIGSVVRRRIGDDRRLTYTAIGNTFRLAIRLQQLAEPDTLVLSDVASRQVQGVTDVAARGLLDILPEGQTERPTCPANTVQSLRL
jgi:DNA-binding winged helix-turn-helix (wHTH) protein/class 3 adenylate cyclase